MNTTEQPKGNMPDHLYHGNIKCLCRSNVYSWHIYIFLQIHLFMFLCSWITTLELSNVCLTKEPSCNVDMIVEKTVLLKMLLLQTGVFFVRYGTLVMLRWSISVISILIQICYVFFVLLKAVSQTLDF